MLRAALFIFAFALASCGLDDLDYAEFQVSCARERCPADFCCNADDICEAGDPDEVGLCPGTR